MPDNRSTAVHSSASRFRRSRQWLIAVAVVAVAAACGTAQASRSAPVAAGPTAAEVHALDVAHNEQRVADIKTFAATEWYNEAQRQEVERFLAAVADAEAEAKAAAAAAAAAANTRKAPPAAPVVTKPAAPTGRSGGTSSPAPAPPPVSGVCGGGGAIADSHIQAESRGNPSAVNPSSGAFGCWQLLPSTAAGCGIGPGASIQQQAACVSKLPSSAWAATGG